MSKTRKFAAGNAHQAAEMWRCYSCLPRGKGFFCQSRLKSLPLDIPSSFQWESRDLDGMRRYIDAVCAGRDAEAAQIEQTGMVTELQYEHETTSGVVTLAVDAVVNFLLLRGSISFPLNKIVRLAHVTRGPKDRRIVTTDIVPDLARLMQEDDPFRGDHVEGPVLHQSRLHQVFTNDNVDLRPQAQAGGEAQAGEGAVESESVVSRRVREDYVDMVTQVVREGDHYLCRRIVDNSGDLIYSATAWSQEGPWKVWSRDNTKLMLLGLNP